MSPYEGFHRFDEGGIERQGNTIIGTRTVNIIKEDNNVTEFEPVKIIPIEEIEKDLYIIFILAEKDEKSWETDIIIKKEVLCLHWKN